MKAIRFALVALLLTSLAHARPNVIDEWVRLPPPTDVNWQLLGSTGVAIDGDWAIVSAYSPLPVWDENRFEAAVLLYHYAGGSWKYQGILGTRQILDEYRRPGLAMKEGIAVVTLQDTRIFELNAGTWTQVPHNLQNSGLSGPDIEINSGRILMPLVSGLSEFYVLAKVNGVWSVQGRLRGQGDQHDPETNIPPDADLEGSRVVAYNEFDQDQDLAPAIRRYYANPDGSGWSQSPFVIRSEGRVSYGPFVAMSGQHTAFSSQRNVGTQVVFDHDNGINFAPYGLQPADGFMEPLDVSDTGIERVRGMFATRNWSPDRKAYVWNIFRMNDDNAHTGEHVFTLQAGNGDSLGGPIDASGNRIIVSGTRVRTYRPPENLTSNIVRIFQLPTNHDPIAAQTFGFEMPNTPAGWQLAPGSVFTVTRVNDNGVWRQASTEGTPAAWLTTNRRTTQSIQSEITLRAISGTDRWVGLATRRTDDANYYYVTLRTNGRIELKRLRAGVITTLASAPATLAVGTKVRLRLESIGGSHRVYLNDRQVLTARDFTLGQGDVGVLTNRAAADFDNIVASPAPFATIYSDDFAVVAPDPAGWTATEGSWQRTAGLVRQSSTTGYARLTVGARTDDQAVQVRVRPTSFTEPGNWVGVLLRYQDTRNHTYVSLMGRGNISLWRRTNGAIQQLGTRNLPVSTGTWYTLRVETVGGETRVFVNDVLQFTSTADLGPNNPDVQGRKGTVGLITQKSTADFDDFLAYQP
ncbi:MAG TPA: family 16 glycoside hydrolase [Steroidobacteraceae bacterium]|nr:family 16 glycoside hydrolase [Steroidobacteraceae bacterium]